MEEDVACQLVDVGRDDEDESHCDSVDSLNTY